MAKRETFNSFLRFVLTDVLLANRDELNLNLPKFALDCGQYFIQTIKFVNSVVSSPFGAWPYNKGALIT